MESFVCDEKECELNLDPDMQSVVVLLGLSSFRFQSGAKIRPNAAGMKPFAANRLSRAASLFPPPIRDMKHFHLH